jgi:hypothetical protein
VPKARPAAAAGSPSWPASRVSRWLLAGAVAGAALAVGTVHTPSLCIVTLVVACAAVAGWWTGEPMRARPAATLLVVTGAVLTVWTALQCVPMPVSWLARIAPHNADVWARALSPLREAGPSWATISEDPVATRVEVLRGAAYLLAFLAALRIARNKEGVGWLSAVIIVTGVLLATASLLHPAFGAKRLFGFYEPGPGIDERHIAPMMNPNNLAGYLNVALCLALAAALAPEPRIPRAIPAALALFLGATQVWVASRGGVVAMLLGALVVVSIVRLARGKRRGSVLTLSLISGIAAATGATLIVLAGSDRASNDLFEGDVSKLHMFAQVMRMFPAVPFVGCGRGAFESAFPAFRSDVGYVTYTHPENVLAQWLLEWGGPVGVAGLATVAFALRPNAALARSTTAAGAWAAIVAVAVQNLSDLGTEVPGLVLAGVVCAAIVVGGTSGRTATWRIERWGAAPRIVAAAAILVAVGGLAFAAPAFGHGLHDDQRAILESALEKPASVEATHAMARAAMLRHPAEPYLPFVVAMRAARENDESAVPWIGATLERAQVYGPAHLLLARVVAGRSPSQARLEYRLAIQQAPHVAEIAMREMPRLVDGYDDALELVPSGKGGIVALESLVMTIGDRLPATRVRLDAELEARASGTVGPAMRAARDWVDDLEAGEAAPWCGGGARAQCEREAMRRLAEAQRIAPDTCEPFVLRARARIASGEVPATALSDLEAASDGVRDRVTCLERLVQLAHRCDSSPRVEAALQKIVSAGCADDAECVRNLTWVASEEEQRGDALKALSLYRRAYAKTPEDEALLQTCARLAAQVGLHAEAAQDYEQLAHMHPADPVWRRAAGNERDQAVRGLVKQ